MNLEQKIRNIITYARLTLSGKDDGNTVIAQVEGLGKPLPVYLIYPYGYSANAPPDSTVFKAAVGGTSQNTAGFPTMPENRFKNLKEWECKVGNFKTRAHVYFDEDGQILLNISDTDSEDYAVRYSELKSGFDELRDDFNKHIHATTATPGTSATPGVISKPSLVSPAPPTPPPNPSTASVDASKIDEIRVP